MRPERFPDPTVDRPRPLIEAPKRLAFANEVEFETVVDDPSVAEERLVPERLVPERFALERFAPLKFAD